MAQEETNPTVVEPPVEPAAKTKDKAGLATKFNEFKSWYVTNKRIAIPASVILLILILSAVPFTRYSLAGMVEKKDMMVKVLDDSSATPVSGARVSIGSRSVDTDAAGIAVLRHVSVGPHAAVISKKYYKDKTVSLTVPILKQKTAPVVQITATGRQVKVTVTNLIDKSALGGVDVTAAGTTAKTDSGGSATLVLPAGVNQQKAKLSLNGYNDADVTIKVSSDKIINNQFNMTPAGKVYFLSKLSGKIDVVKTNLDGTDRQTVLDGTGNEDDQNTVLLASRDWKYLALLSRRAGSSPSIYLINTFDDSLSTIDEGSASFSLVGWVDDNFVYTVTRNNTQAWQPNTQAVKSFNAASKKTTVLDQTTASGTGPTDYLQQQLGDVYGYDGQVYYVMNWAGYNEAAQLAAKQATFNSVKTDGTAKKAIKSFAPDPSGISSLSYASFGLFARVEKPDKVHIESFDSNGNNKYYLYSGGQVKDDTSPNISQTFFNTYPTYLQSPSGNNTFWSEPRDGKNTLFVGDEDGENQKQIATLSDYSPYGWYTDDYLLVSKNSSELYIMDKEGKQAPLKISDYHKPSQSFPGYGGGYGGL